MHNCNAEESFPLLELLSKSLKSPLKYHHYQDTSEPDITFSAQTYQGGKYPLGQLAHLAAFNLKMTHFIVSRLQEGPLTNKKDLPNLTRNGEKHSVPCFGRFQLEDRSDQQYYILWITTGVQKE